MIALISMFVSLLAFVISLLTFWLLYTHRGRIEMTQPTLVAFCYDGELYEDSNRPKIYLRAYIFSTSRRGHVIENLFVKLSRGETAQNFNIWVYGEKNLSRGSGMHVKQDGLVYNHHFLLPADGTSYEFLPGEYKVEIFMTILGSKKNHLIKSLNFKLTVEQADAIKMRRAVFFDWAPNTKDYFSSIHTSPLKRLEERS